MLTASPVQGYLACCEALSTLDQRALLPRIKSPTLVIAGRHDPGRRAEPRAAIFLGPDRLPPPAVGAVPLDSGAQAFVEVGVRWTPAQLVVQRRRIDRIPQVVAGAVARPPEAILC